MTDSVLNLVLTLPCGLNKSWLSLGCVSVPLLLGVAKELMSKAKPLERSGALHQRKGFYQSFLTAVGNACEPVVPTSIHPLSSPHHARQGSVTQGHPPNPPPCRDVPRIEEEDEERNRDSKLQPAPGADQVCHSGQDELTQGKGVPQQDPGHGPAPGGHPLHDCRGNQGRISGTTAPKVV